MFPGSVLPAVAAECGWAGWDAAAGTDWLAGGKVAGRVPAGRSRVQPLSSRRYRLKRSADSRAGAPDDSAAVDTRGRGVPAGTSRECSTCCLVCCCAWTDELYLGAALLSANTLHVVACNRLSVIDSEKTRAMLSENIIFLCQSLLDS